MSDRQANLYPQHLAEVCRRHDAALAASGFERLVIHSGTPRVLYMDDMASPFRANPPFKAWVPLVSHPDCFVVYEPGNEPVLVYYQPTDYWHSVPQAPNGYWVEHFDLRVVGNAADAAGHLPTESSGTAWLGAADQQPAGTAFAVNPDRLVSELDFARAAKTPYELECMREASRLGAVAHVAARNAFFEGASEFDIHLAYCTACGQDSDELPYSNIIAINENGATLHYTALGRTAQSKAGRHSFLIDAGASFCGYASDITRSYSYSSEVFGELVEAIDALQQTLCRLVTPGRSYVDVHLAAHDSIGHVLAGLGLVKCSAEAAVEQGLTSVFFPHGVGHLIGLQVHDVGGHQKNPEGDAAPPPAEHPFLRLTRTLEPGHVVTIEPGVYIIDQLLDEARAKSFAGDINWETVDRLRQFGGVRIEDDVVVTGGEPENLTRDAFASIA